MTDGTRTRNAGDKRNSSIVTEAEFLGRAKLLGPAAVSWYCTSMNAIEFTAELSSGEWLHIPADAAAQLPKDGRFKVIIMPALEPHDSEWRCASYQQFMRDDAAEDAIYDSLA